MKMTEKNGVSYYYTCPAQASKYNDTAGILIHYDHILEQQGEHPWVWTIDCVGFSLKHAVEIQTAIGLSKLISAKYGEHLQQILVKRPTWHIHSLLFVVWPFLSKHVQSLIVMENDTEPKPETEYDNQV
jgi:hypothetical protein